MILRPTTWLNLSIHLTAIYLVSELNGHSCSLVYLWVTLYRFICNDNNSCMSESWNMKNKKVEKNTCSVIWDTIWHIPGFIYLGRYNPWFHMSWEAHLGYDMIYPRIHISWEVHRTYNMTYPRLSHILGDSHFMGDSPGVQYDIFDISHWKLYSWELSKCF